MKDNKSCDKNGKNACDRGNTEHEFNDCLKFNCNTNKLENLCGGK